MRFSTPASTSRGSPLVQAWKVVSEWSQEREGGEASWDSEDVRERMHSPFKRGVQASAIECNAGVWEMDTERKGNTSRKEETPLGRKRGEVKYNVVIGHHCGRARRPLAPRSLLLGTDAL